MINQVGWFGIVTVHGIIAGIQGDWDSVFLEALILAWVIFNTRVHIRYYRERWLTPTPTEGESDADQAT